MHLKRVLMVCSYTLTYFVFILQVFYVDNIELGFAF